MATQRKMTFDDLWTLNEIGTIALSPDSKRVAYVVHTDDKAKNETRSAIWLLHLDEQGSAVGSPRRLTSGTKHDSGPAWSPDSRHLLFLSDREEGKQLWLIDTDGGEASKLTAMLRGVSEAAWSPDGQWIAFTALVATDDDDDLLMGRKTLNADEKKKRHEEERTRLRTINRIFYRLDGFGIFEKFLQLFVMPAPALGATSVDAAAIRRLTSGDYGASGDFGYGLPTWTPDSQYIGVLCNRNEDRDRSFVSDLWLIERESGEARCLTDGSLQIESFAWSPDGQRAMLVAEKDMRIAGGCNPHLYLVAREGGELRDMSAAIDNYASVAAFCGFGAAGRYRPQWSDDGAHVYFLVTERGCINVYRLDITSGETTRLTSGEQLIAYLALLPDERGLILAQAQSVDLWDICYAPMIAGSIGVLEKLTQLNDALLSQLALSTPQRITYQGANGDEIEGWVMLPVGAKPGVRYPLAVRIHGGPQSAYGVGMNPYHQLMAAHGFAVFYCNPHGSTGHGQDFMREVEGDWGGRDYQDIMRGVDECIARGIADPERLVVSGYSYGGYMSMYVIGQTDRFKAAVPMAGISNLVSFVGTSDIGFWQAAQSHGYPWESERAAYYHERSPLSHASKVTTPTLFVHPENDLRCPIEQTEQFYITLKIMGHVPVEFARAPGAWHVGTAKPAQYVEYWKLMLDWFEKYVEIRPEEYI
ncbi:MAG: S9 family peptidase [Ktedonobacteraceae bacterium]